MTQMAKQRPAREGLYASEILDNRFQVLESDIMPGSYCVYDLVKDNAVRSKDGTIAYMSSVEAATAVARGMAVPTVRTKEAAKAAKEKAPKASKERGETANSMMNSLIKEGKMSDAEIAAAVLVKFPECTYCRAYHVKYRRKQVEK